MALDAAEIGDFLAGLDDAPIPLPWRGRVYYAPPPDAERGKRIVAYWTLVGMPDRSLEDLERVLRGETAHELMIGAETCAEIVAAGIRDEVLTQMATLCMIRWATGSEDKARAYLTSQREAQSKAADPPAVEELAQEARPKSRAGSRRKTSRTTASGSRTPKAGTPTT